jgi:hypothetical protein
MSWMETYYMIQVVVGGALAIVLALYVLGFLFVLWMSR